MASLVLGFILVCPPIEATPLSPERLIEARQDFQAALINLNKGNRTRFHQIKATLEDYPLYPYLEYYEIRRYISSTSKEDIQTFLSQYGDSTVGIRLNRQWLRLLAEKGQWDDFINHFQPTSDANLNCNYHWAQFQTGDKESAFRGAEKLWLVGHSQSSACDPLFQAWKKTDSFNDELIWQRIELSIENGKYQLASYLSRYLSPDEQKTVELWTQVRRYPHKLKRISRFDGDDPKHRRLIAYSLKRLLLKDPELALTLWDEYEATFPFTNDEKHIFQEYAARLLAYRYHEDAAYWLTLTNTDEMNEGWLERLIRVALRNENWRSVYHWITLLPEEKRNSSRWLYWQARALEHFEQQQEETPTAPVPLLSAINHNELRYSLQIHDEFVHALLNVAEYDKLLPDYVRQSDSNAQIHSRLLFKAISYQRGFYAFLASEHVQKPLTLRSDISRVTDLELLKLESYAGIQRARELYFIGRHGDARSEWYYATLSLTPSERSIAARLADSWGWHHQAIVTAATSDQRDNLELRFPTAFKNIVSYHASKNGIVSDWVFSLIRQESAFTPDAKSSVGAMGLMQIMPNTGKQLTRSAGISYRGQTTLLDPEKNVQLGTLYLSQLLKKFDGNIIFATAAYNAGPYRVDKWIPEVKPLPADIWIETIPIQETREYVQNIMTYQAIYRHNLGREAKITQWLSKSFAKQPEGQPLDTETKVASNTQASNNKVN